MKIIVQNLAIEYEDQGSGPVIFMLHGWKDSLRTFDTIIPELVKSHRVVRVDLPGFGRSQIPNEPWDILKYVEFVDVCIKKLQIDVEILLGHSLGGRIAIKGVGLGILKPRKLVLVAAAGVSHSKSLRSQSFKVVAKLGKVVTFVLPQTFRQKLRQKLYVTAGSDYLGAGELKESYLKIINEDLQSFGRQISVPTLLLWGENDEAAPLDDGKKWNILIQNSKLVIFKNASHFVHQEKPQEISDAIKNFIQES